MEGIELNGWFHTGLVGKRQERRQLEYPGKHGRIFKKQDEVRGMIWLRMRTSGGHLGKL